MTEEFDKLYNTIISEVLVGSKKRNKKLDENNLADVNHITAMPRNINKHPAHIRPISKTIGNETGVHSKKPDAKPVYAKGGMRHMKNASQRASSLKASPYSSNHFKHGTRRTLADRRRKLIKSLYESNGVPPFGTYRLYFITDGTGEILTKGMAMTQNEKSAKYKAEGLTKKNKKEYSVVFVRVEHDKDKNVLIKGNSDTTFYYDGPTRNGTITWTTDVGKHYY